MGCVCVPVYQFVHEPTHLEELDWGAFETLFIWRDNQTVIWLSKNDSLTNFPQRNASFVLYLHDNEYIFQCAIYGITDAAIAETVTFCWSLPCSRESRIATRHSGLFQFPFENLQNDQLARFFGGKSATYVGVFNRKLECTAVCDFGHAPGYAKFTTRFVSHAWYLVVFPSTTMGMPLFRLYSNDSRRLGLWV